MSSNPDDAGSGAAPGTASAPAPSVAETAALRPVPVGAGATAVGRPPRFEIGPRVYRAARVRPYSPQPGDPLVRPLRIFTLDPATSVLDGAVAEVDVPYEPVAPGPVGALFEIDPVDGVHGVRYRAVDLDDPRVLIRVGRDPSVSDPEFHQQMVYAVASLVYAAFRAALGRDVAWGFKQPAGPSDAPLRLRLRPHAFAGANAFYDPDTGSIAFGYYPAAQDVVGRNLPGGYVFTCLSHDVVVHEVTHALLDGLRAHFASPTGRDVLAFHESFADLIAVFQHFSYPQVVLSAIRQSRGNLLAAELLTGIATQFGHTTGSKQPLRTAIDVTSPEDAPLQYADAGDEPHERGRVLTAAVFEAFATVFRRRTERYIRLATGGSGVLPPGELPHDLQVILAEQASKLARHFLSICIRAVDYCPPVDLELGEFLRAAITADRDLVPGDPWKYREAWIDAFRRRGIYPQGVRGLSEDELVWRAPNRPIAEAPELSFSSLRFDGDPGRAAGPAELQRQAEALGRLVADPAHMDEFGLATAGDARLAGDRVDLPRIESIRTSRRIGPNGNVLFDLVAEITQCRYVRRDGVELRHYGGATVVLDPRGAIRYVVSKSVLNERRLEQHLEWVGSAAGRRYWAAADGRLVPRGNPFRLVHEEARQ